MKNIERSTLALAAMILILAPAQATAGPLGDTGEALTIPADEEPLDLLTGLLCQLGPVQDQLCSNQVWDSDYNGPMGSVDIATDVVVAPDGERVFITGRSVGEDNVHDYATIAYSTATGQEEWIARYGGPGVSTDAAEALAVSADGSRLFVTGWSRGDGTGFDFATIAYDTADGSTLWETRYDGPAGRLDYGVTLGLGPDDETLYVAGQSESDESGFDYLVAAYDTDTGEESWTARYDGTGNGRDIPRRLAVDSVASALYVTGWSAGTDSEYEFDAATVAYDLATGDELWVTRHDGGEDASDGGTDVSTSLDGTSVYVTGWLETPGGTARHLFVAAYDAADGGLLWEVVHDGPVNDTDTAISIATTPDGSQIFVTGQSTGTGTERDILTLAYTSTGTQLWSARYDGPVSDMDVPRELSVSPDGARVYVTGQSFGIGPTNTEIVTIAYDALTGLESWATRYGGSASHYDGAFAVDVSPDSERVYVTGSIVNLGTGDDYATLAYNATMQVSL